MTVVAVTPTGECATCGGTGGDEHAGVCGACGGSGLCPGCGGTRLLDGAPCYRCGSPVPRDPTDFEMTTLALKDGSANVKAESSGEGAALLEFVSAKQLAFEVDNAPPVRFLCRPVWPADAYGVCAAEKKAGKTWQILDLAVSVASGTAWLGVYEVDQPGPVLLFLGEGGKRKMLRRFRAVCEDRGVKFEDLPIELCFRVPHLTNMIQLALMAEKIGQQRPALVIVDPLYLAARGSKGASLYDMGEALEGIQNVAQHYDAALCIVHHWNQTGTGKGADRMSGAGPAEWGRVLVSASVESRRIDPVDLASIVTLSLEFTGDEIPDTPLRIRRRVWTDDPDDLNSAMHYTVEELAPAPPSDTADGLKPSARRVLDVLRAATEPLTVRLIGDALAVDNTGLNPLKERTIQDALGALQNAELAECVDINGRTGVWRAHTPENEVENVD
ncbi:MAG: hypothetical protein QOK28_2013 [Actinomycetota bacterium]